MTEKNCFVYNYIISWLKCHIVMINYIGHMYSQCFDLTLAKMRVVKILANCY